nr:RILP-like protein 2 [Pogona vitticeps]
MQAEQHQEEEEEEEEGDGDGEPGSHHGPDNPFEKGAFQLTAEDVYDISYLLGREMHKLSTEPRLDVAAHVAQLQFKVVGVLEMLEALVSENNLTVEALKMERDSLRKELESLRKQVACGTTGEANVGPNKMVIDLTDPNRPRFTLQELREVLQERNQLKAQLLVVQEELQCYKSGIISQKQDWIEPAQKEMNAGAASGSRKGKMEKATIKQLFTFKRL